MQKDYLSLMGIQAWQSRNIVKLESGSTLVHKNIGNAQVDDEPSVVVVNKQNDEIQNEHIKPRISAYAAISQRHNSSGYDERWLWVAPQSTLPAAELQLLDKIVSATGSYWESVGMADNYVQLDELDTFLHEPVSAIVVLAKSIQWDTFHSSQLYQDKRFSIGIELQELFTNPEKKRQLWQSLQQLMDDD